VEEIARLFSVHRNTVREWVKGGLAINDDQRPMLILGCDLFTFLQSRRAKNKRPCKSGEIYCVRCRAPKPPAGDMADYKPVTKNLGNLIAICPDCDAIMYQRISLTGLEQIRRQLDIRMPQAPRQLSESTLPSVNSDLV
jgi:hypothetical protein